MKKQFLFAVLILLVTACSKIDQKTVIRVGGVLPDDPKKVAKVPLVMSKYFSPRSSMSNVWFRGKPTKVDTIAPYVVITSPMSGSTITSSVLIKVNASDNKQVSFVSLTVNDIPLITDFVAPYEYTWNTSNVMNGTYVIKATAQDAAGNYSTNAVTVTKNVIITPPVDTNSTSSWFVKPMPTPGDQGSEGSCVAFSVGYAARSVEWYTRTAASSYSQSTNIFSPEFLYNQTKFSTDCNSGTAMQMVLDFLQTKGVCTWATMPYSTVNGCALLPNETQLTEAITYKINNYVKVYTADSAAIKSLIRSNKPVIISVSVDNVFLNATSDFIWKEPSPLSFGHSLVICGYDDVRKAYRLFNSFGPDWAGNGYCWIDYDFFLTRTGTYCYAINY